MADGDEELEDLDPSGPEEDSSEIPEQAGAQGHDLRTYDQHLGQLIKQGEQAGYGDQTVTLKRIRRALRHTTRLVQEAEERARDRALAEFQADLEQNGPDNLVAQLREQVRGELQQETARERSLARLGIGPDSPVRSLFDGVSGDQENFERQAALLRAAGVSWDADPVVRRVGQEQVAQWTQAAQNAAQNGNGISLDPAGPVPQVVRDTVIRQGVEAMQAGQAGGEPIGGRSEVERLVDRARANPETILDDAARQDFAERINAQLDALSQQAQGRPPL